MDKALLDTDVLSETLKGVDQSVLSAASTYRAEHGRFTTSVITVMEVVKGLHRVGREDRIAEFLRNIAAEEVLNLDIQSAETAGRIYADLERTGQPIGRADPMIAAIAIAHALTLVTGNAGHYQRIRDLAYSLKLDNWRSA